MIKLSFYMGFKNEMTYKFSKYIKQRSNLTWLKNNKWTVNLFWCSSDLYLYHQI